MEHPFDFETLDAYRVALEVAQWARRVRWPDDAGKLRDEGIRACDSVVLNLAEGRLRGGAPGRNHLRIAKGSAGEAFAVLALARPEGATEQQQKLRRVAAMLTKMR